jgi:outer membrane protein, heavy metal efflux system
MPPSSNSNSSCRSRVARLLWRLRTDLRSAFYRLPSAQTREGVLAGGTQELEEVIRILRVRETEGEGSKYDRLRAERELAEYRSQLAAARADVVQARAALIAYLPEGANVTRVAGSLQTIALVRPIDSLISQAFSHRPDFLMDQRQIEQYRLEARAAERLRFPEPLAIAGLKRGDITPGRTETSTAVGISVPLPLFNKGKTEVARWTAERERAVARQQALERRIRAEVAGAFEALQLRQGAIDQYRREVDPIGTDLSRITLTAYQEGETGILELLDSYRVNRQARLRALDLETLAKEAAIELDRAVGEEVAP